MGKQQQQKVSSIKIRVIFGINIAIGIVDRCLDAQPKIQLTKQFVGMCRARVPTIETKVIVAPPKIAQSSPAYIRHSCLSHASLFDPFFYHVMIVPCAPFHRPNVDL